MQGQHTHPWLLWGPSTYNLWIAVHSKAEPLNNCKRNHRRLSGNHSNEPKIRSTILLLLNNRQTSLVSIEISKKTAQRTLPKSTSNQSNKPCNSLDTPQTAQNSCTSLPPAPPIAKTKLLLLSTRKTKLMLLSCCLHNQKWNWCCCPAASTSENEIAAAVLQPPQDRHRCCCHGCLALSRSKNEITSAVLQPPWTKTNCYCCPTASMSKIEIATAT